jgi:hypothetical protein
MTVHCTDRRRCLPRTAHTGSIALSTLGLVVLVSQGGCNPTHIPDRPPSLKVAWRPGCPGPKGGDATNHCTCTTDTAFQEIGITAIDSANPTAPLTVKIKLTCAKC